MTMLILGTMRGAGDGVYYTDSFRAVFEDHIQYLRDNAVPVGEGNQSTTNSTAVIQPVSAQDAYWFRYRPNQYFREKLGVEPQFYWYVLRCSRLTSPEAFDESIRELYVPSWTFVRQLASTHQTDFATV
jgi:hypothetical protein